MNRSMALTALMLFAAPALADGVYIGKFENGPQSARIAFVAAGNQFVGYVCSDEDAFNGRYSRWLTGAVKKSGEATAEAEQLYLHATIKDEVVMGGVQTADGESMEFTAARIADESAAGLFRFVQLTDEDRLVDGWIVDEEGEIVGKRDTVKRKKSAIGPKSSKNAAGNAKGSKTTSSKNSANAGSSNQNDVQVLSAKKLTGRLRSSVKTKAGDLVKGASKKESTKKALSSNGNSGAKGSTSEKAKTSAEKSSKSSVANSDVSKSNKSPGDEQAADGQVAQGDKQSSKSKNKQGQNNNENAGEQGQNNEEVTANQGQKAKQKQGAAEAAENENAGVAAVNEAAAEGVEQINEAAEKAAKRQAKGLLREAALNLANQNQQPQKIRNVEQVNIVNQEEAAAAEDAEAPQPVEVENVRVVNRVNGKKEAKAPLPGEVVEGNLTGVDDEERVLTVDNGDEVLEVPVGNRQMIVVDEEGARAAEEPANAKAQGALKGKPGKMLKKLAASGSVPVRVRIGAKNVVVKQQEAEQQ